MQPPVQRVQTSPAVVQISEGEVGLDGLSTLLRVKPEAKVSIELSDKTVTALLRHTGVLSAADHDAGEQVTDPP